MTRCGHARHRARRAVVMAEAGIVYSTALLMLMGTMVGGMGVFRYQELAYQARAAARWASIQPSPPSSADVMSKGIRPIALQPASLSASVSQTSINSTPYINVTLTYQWAPEFVPGFSSVMVLASTSRQPMAP